MFSKEDRQLIIKSANSSIYEYQDLRWPVELVLKKPEGVTTYFFDSEKSINESIQRFIEQEKRDIPILKYYGNTERKELILERAKENLADATPLNPKRFGRMVAEVTEAVFFLDEHLIAHNDLHRLENIFIMNDGRFKLGDFGFSAAVGNVKETHNVDAFAANIATYICVKILEIDNPFESPTDIKGEIEKSDRLSTRFKKIFIDFLNTASKDYQFMMEFALQLVCTRSESWLE